MQEHMDINKQIHDYGMWRERERERERNTGEEDVAVELRREARGGGSWVFYRGEEDWKEEFEVWRVELGRWTENEKAGTSVILD